MSSATESLPKVSVVRPRVTLPVAVNAFRWLLVDTFRQAAASKIFWVIVTLTALCVLFCLGVSVESGLSEPLPGDTELYTRDNRPVTATVRPEGAISIFFGLLRVPHARGVEDAVRFLQVWMTALVAGAFGFVMALVWTSGFVPEFLQPHNASVLLAKPAPRWLLLVGKYLGVVVFVALMIGVFFVGTWCALGVRTDVWSPEYLLAAPLFIVSFAAIYGFTVLLAVVTRSTVACIFGSIVFWLCSWGMNLGRHFLIGLESLTQGRVAPGMLTAWITEVGYWLLPKPADVVIVQEQILGASAYTATLSKQPAIQAVLDGNAFLPDFSILASLAFGVGAVLIAARQLSKLDY